jgi:hypothetical protein
MNSYFGRNKLCEKIIPVFSKVIILIKVIPSPNVKCSGCTDNLCGDIPYTSTGVYTVRLLSSEYLSTFLHVPSQNGKEVRISRNVCRDQINFPTETIGTFTKQYVKNRYSVTKRYLEQKITKRYKYKTVHETKRYTVTKRYVAKRCSIIFVKYFKVHLNLRGNPTPARYAYTYV